ncbi:tetratricopeptide repeat protein [Pedobacter sp. UC225_61]|uniref:tetratricopeptide repeat protein n=1 Tax=Pedobacter sp. UC225_61 TaxID=3374623 RepID=UPI0037928FC4
MYTYYLRYLFIGALVCLNYQFVLAQNNSETFVSTHPDKTAYASIKGLLDTALSHNDSYAAGIYYQQIGDIFFKEGVMPQALAYYFKANSAFLTKTFSIENATNLNKIGRVYYKTSRLTNAMQTFNKSLGICNRINYARGNAEADKYIAQIFEKMGRLDSAHYYLERALIAYKKLHNKEQVSFTYSKIGGIYEDELRFAEALPYFFKALDLYRTNKSVEGKAGLLNNIGDVYRKMSNYKTALRYTKQAEQLALQLNDFQQMSSAHRDLAKTYEMVGRFDSAYYYSEKARSAYAKSFNSETDKKLNLLQTLFDVEQKNKEISRLEKDQFNNRVFIFLAGLVVVLIAISGYSIVSKQRLKSKDEKIIHDNIHQNIELELNNKLLQEQHLKAQLELQSKELSSHILLIIQKNQFLELLKQEVASIIKDDKRDNRRELKQLIATIDENTNQDKNWEDFRIIYENVHHQFFDKLLAYEESLSATDLRFLALLKMNLHGAELATLLGISQNSLRTVRYRVKKKLRLTEQDSLTQFIQQF